MSSLRAALLGAWAFAATASPAYALDYVLGGGVGADDSNGRSLAGLVDVGLTESTFVTLTAAVSDADTVTSNIETRSYDLTISQDFEPFSFSLGAGRWGDDDLIESDDLRARIAVDVGAWRFGIDGERRDIELVFQIVPIGDFDGRRITAGVNGDGFGGNVRYRGDDGWSVSLRGMTWDYDRNVDGLALFDLTRRVNPTTLTLAGALRDSSYLATAEWPIGDHLVGIELGRDELAIGDLVVESATVLWTIPSSARTDLELSLGYSESDDGDGAFYASVFVYFFGGSK
ncbi:MAG: hypothetical protein AAFX44_05435 [Pseudomonadota bacterium]